MNLPLTPDDVRDVVMILGAASEVFREMSEDQKTPGIFRKLMKQYADGADRFTDMIVKAHNEEER